MRRYVDSMGIATPDTGVLAPNSRFKQSKKLNMMPYIDGVSVEYNFYNRSAVPANMGARPDLVVFTGMAYERISNKSSRPKTNMRSGDVRDIKTGKARFSQKQKNKNVTHVNGFMGYTVTTGNQEAVRPK